MSEIATLGIDLAKSVFQLHGVSERGTVVLRKQARRAQLLSVVAQIPACVIGQTPANDTGNWNADSDDALVGAVADARAFKNGRHMAAWLGLVPRQDSIRFSDREIAANGPTQRN